MRRLLYAAFLVVLSTLVLASGAIAVGAAGGGSTAVPAAAGARAQRSYIEWYQAKSHVGEKRSVRGPVKGTEYSTSSTGRPTFLNVGKDYPNKGRFTVVIWGKDRGNFPFRPEVKYRGRTIIVTGRISTYKGVAQMYVRSPSAIKIAD